MEIWAKNEGGKRGIERLRNMLLSRIMETLVWRSEPGEYSSSAQHTMHSSCQTGYTNINDIHCLPQTTTTLHSFNASVIHSNSTANHIPPTMHLLWINALHCKASLVRTLTDTSQVLVPSVATQAEAGVG